MSQLATNPRPSRLFGQYIIKHNFQFKISLILFIVLGVSTFTLWLESHFAVSHLIETGAITTEESITQVKLLSSILGKTGILINGVTLGLILFLSHFIAGPIYRFEKTLADIRDGNLNLYVRLRKHDELKDLAEQFNQTLASLRNKLAKERDAVHANVAKLEKLSEELKQAGHGSEAAKMEALVTEFKNSPIHIKIA